MVIVAPLLCMMFVVNVDVLDVPEPLPIVLDVDDVVSSCHLMMFII